MASTHPVAKSIIVDTDGKFLLLTRSHTHPTLADYYDLPGGMIEPGEEPGTAVSREILEETGINIAEPTLLYTTTMMIGAKSYPTLLYYVELTEKSPDVTLSWEHGGYEWASLDKLPEVEPQLAPTYQKALAYIRDNDILNGLLKKTND